MVSEHQRRELFGALQERLGEAAATTLMELLPPVGWGDLARQSDLVAVRGEMSGLGAELRGEMFELRTELKGEMSELRTELKGGMSELRSELKGEMSELRGELAILSARIDAQGARIDAQLPRFLWANVPIMFATAGLVLAAANLG